MVKTKTAYFTCLFLFLITISSFGCEKNPEDAALIAPKIQMAVAESPCNFGEVRDFEMDIVNEGLESHPNADYYIRFGATPIYNTEDNCLCRVTEVTLTFDELPSTSLFTVKGLNGNLLAYDGPFSNINGSDEYIKVYPGVLEPHIIIEFDPIVNPTPLLINAGGYCVIDNLSGPKTALQRMEVYVEDNPETNWPEFFLPVIL